VSGLIVPAKDAMTEFTEKHSRFIGRIFRTDTAAEAEQRIRQVRAMEPEARHNVFAYVVKENNASRFSDDGEPQGTGGRPVLEVLNRSGLTNVCCVVTRYFGGILLGAGGLTRAYARSAADAVEAAGKAELRQWDGYRLECTYPLYERVKIELENAEARLGNTDFAENVRLEFYLMPERVQPLSLRLRELSAGKLELEATGQSEMKI